MTAEPPAPAAAAALRELFAELLELTPEQVGPEDDFFHLGGNSQLAIRLAARVRNRLQVKLAVADVFDAPTVAGLADRVAQAPPAAALPKRHAGNATGL
ncbi:acyl carrier protein [Kitasatospora sp. NPDC006697]|uniref:acyl carrier protein n=1 Tax=Kitasatospora sp. NPDC006697 TaxID=3364020 RepID=UPI0036751654